MGFLLGEIITRIHFFGKDAFSYTKVNSFGILDNSNIIKYSSVKGLKYELIPNLNTHYKLVPFETNQEGFRDENHAIEKDTNTIRIAIIGDSFTMGTGVEKEELYSNQLSNLLNHKGNYEIMNFGVAGYSLTEYLLVYDNKVAKYNPDIVIIGFCASNDHLIFGKDYNLTEFVIKPKKNVFWDSYLIKLFNMRLSPKPNKNFYNPDQLEYVNLHFQNLRKKIKNKNGIIFYMDLDYDQERIFQIEELALKNNLEFIESSSFFKNKQINKYIVNELDTHPNGKANKMFAKKIENYLIKNLD
jgi:lysophospholipase L1-like esterase